MSTEPLSVERPRQVAPPGPRRAPTPAPSSADRIVRTQNRAATRAAETASPWWFSAPKVLLTCGRVAFLPFTLAVKVAELAMATVILGIVAVGGAWYLGYITDKNVVDALKPVGDRLLAMVQGAGLL